MSNMPPSPPSREPDDAQRADLASASASASASHTGRHVLMIGATGMLGRPVARRLVQEQFHVRAMVRNTNRARTLLPEQCELVAGDLRDETALRSAMSGMDAVYINLPTPASQRVWNIDLHGTKLIADAAARTGIKHLLRISAMGASESSNQWWVMREKAEADQAVIDSGVPYTIFRPTWYMESLALFAAGSFMLKLNVPEKPLWWIAGDDCGRQVAAALLSIQAINRIYTIQGSEPMTMPDALRRFASALPRRYRMLPVPMAMLRVAGVAFAEPRYMADLIDMTFKYTSRFDAQAAWDDLGTPTMTVEDYAAYTQKTGDFPCKASLHARSTPPASVI